MNAVLLVCILSGLGCTPPRAGDNVETDAEPVRDSDELGAIECEDAPLVTYATFGRAFLTTYCSGCHAKDATDRGGAPPESVFDTAEEAAAAAERIATRVFFSEQAPMPPAGGLTPQDTERAWVWLQCFPDV